MKKSTNNIKSKNDQKNKKKNHRTNWNGTRSLQSHVITSHLTSQARCLYIFVKVRISTQLHHSARTGSCCCNPSIDQGSNTMYLILSLINIYVLNKHGNMFLWLRELYLPVSCWLDPWPSSVRSGWYQHTSNSLFLHGGLWEYRGLSGEKPHITPRTDKKEISIHGGINPKILHHGLIFRPYHSGCNTLSLSTQKSLH